MDTSERAVVKRESQRRRWPVEEKCRIVEQTLKPGASVARVALAHGVNANQVFSWRRQYRQGLLGKRNAGPVDLLPVHVSEAQSGTAYRSGSPPMTAAVAGTIQVEFPQGHVCVTYRLATKFSHRLKSARILPCGKLDTNAPRKVLNSSPWAHHFFKNSEA
jgi:transposase